MSEVGYEQALEQHTVDLQINQHMPGKFSVDLGTREVDGTVLYYGDHNQPYLAYLTPPPDCVSIIAGSSQDGAVAANGKLAAQDSVFLLPPNQAIDLVVPAQTSADTVTIPETRFYELAEAVSPGLEAVTRPSIVRSDAAHLHWLRKRSRMLVHTPSGDPGHVGFDNLIAEWVAWLGRPDAISEQSHSVAREHRAKIARRARSYFMEHYAQPLRMEDACKEMGVGLRTLQRCFADYFQMSPYQYLKVLRYNKARHALLQEEPETSSVTHIAMDSGFQHFGRFAVEYRDLFGELPRDTLAERPLALAA